MTSALVDEPETELTAGRRPVDGRRRVLMALAAAAVAVGLGFAAWSIPALRTELLMSFTEQQQPYAELYFTSVPTFEGATVSVPVTLTDHGEGAKGYQVTVVLESPDGKQVDATTVHLAGRYNAPEATVVKLQAKSQVAMVRVALLDHPQTLYYRFGKVQLPDH